MAQMKVVGSTGGGNSNLISKGKHKFSNKRPIKGYAI